MQFRILIFISLTVLLNACGRPESKKSSLKTERITPEQMSQIISNQSIVCSDDDFCPEGIARMFSINFEDVNSSSTCTAFLVAPDVVMTNTHCVYKNNHGLDKVCSGLYFAFSGVGLSHIAQCSKIIWRDRKQHGRQYYREGDNDFALIKLDRSIPLVPLRLLSGELLPGTTVYPLVVDQISGNKARITKLECEIEKSIPKYGVIQLSDCPIISGNSGSPVLDKDHNVLGIIFASSNNEIKKPSDELSVRRKAVTKGFAFSTNQIQSILGQLI